MQPNANAERNRTSEVEPTITHTVPWRVSSVTALPDARLRVIPGTGHAVNLEEPAELNRLCLAFMDEALVASR
jgi:pimeloyl-ACP methyl ester carboxylesterase